MVALNEKFSQCWVPASEGRVSPDVIEGFDFTKGSEEVRGGSVVNFGGAGFRGLFDASPLRRRSAASVHRNGPETQLYYVRNRMYNRARYTVLRQELKSPGRPGRASKKIAVLRENQRDQIGCSGGINLYEYAKGDPVLRRDPSGLQVVSPGCPCIAPPINAAAAEAAAALLAALAAELDWPWIPDVALAAAAAGTVLLAWEITCRNLYAAYKSACDEIANYPCRKGMYCDQYPAAISIRTTCAIGRAAYLNAGCDVIIPTRVNHMAAVLQAWQAVANCEKASKNCVPTPVCPVTG